MKTPIALLGPAKRKGKSVLLVGADAKYAAKGFGPARMLNAGTAS